MKTIFAVEINGKAGKTTRAQIVAGLKEHSFHRLSHQGEIKEKDLPYLEMKNGGCNVYINVPEFYMDERGVLNENIEVVLYAHNKPSWNPLEMQTWCTWYKVSAFIFFFI